MWCLAVFFVGVAGVVEWSHPKQALNIQGVTSRALDLRLEVPTSIEDPEATMKLIHVTTLALHAPREVGRQPQPGD